MEIYLLFRVICVIVINVFDETRKQHESNNNNTIEPD